MSDHFVVFPGLETPWRLGYEASTRPVIETVRPSDDEAPADAVARRLAELGRRAGPVLLALPSRWCFAAPVAPMTETGARKDQALAFRLEEEVPLSGEELVADSVPVDDHEILAVGAALREIRPVVEGLEGRGVEVRSITPAALLAAAEAAARVPELDAALVGDSGEGTTEDRAELDLVVYRTGRPARWWWLADDRDALADRLAALTADDGAGPTVACVGAASDADEPPASTASFVDVPSLDAATAATAYGGRLRAGELTASIELRRGPLAAPGAGRAYRRPAGALAAAAAALLVAVSGVAQLRGRAYRELTRTFDRKQAAVFREVFPDRKVPASVKRRLASEKRKLAGLGGAAGGAGDARIRVPSALTRLEEVLRSVPKGAGLAVEAVQIGPDRVRLEGRAASYREAERLVRRLREAGPYQVDPPETRSAEGGRVRFVFTARVQRSDAGGGDRG